MSHANVPLVVGVVFDDGSFLLDIAHARFLFACTIDDGSFLLDWLHGFLLDCTCTIPVCVHHCGAVHGR